MSTRSPRACLEAGTLLGDWRIEGVIGIGGMGTVYAAVHTVIGKHAAIKVVRSELCSSPLTMERFVQEARVANTIEHPNIVDIFHIGTLEDGRPYLVMELLHGKTLGARMAEGRVPAPEALDVIEQICDALAAAHARGVVHRDLKPDNVFLCEGGSGPFGVTIKLVDWGIAKLMDKLPSRGTWTTAGTLVGTPQYMSPEQARAREVDGRSDVYSLGTMAYELLLEGPPFQADNVADLVAMHLREDPPPLHEVWPAVPPELEQLVLAMLAKSPDERPSIDVIRATVRRVNDQLGQRRDNRGERFLLSAPPELIDRTPTWGMSPTPELVAELRRIPARKVVSAAASTTGMSRRSRIAHASLLAGAVLVFAAVGTVLTGAGGPAAIVPAQLHGIVQRHVGLARAPVLEVVPAVAPIAAMSMQAPGAAIPAPSLAEPPVPTRATLDLHVFPRNARVSVDGARAKVRAGRVRRTVEPGVLDVWVRAPGFTPYHRRIEIGPGTVMLDVHLERRRSIASPSHKPESRRAVLDVDPDGTIDPFP